MSKIGRNSPCPCGSGKKYKLCCGRPEPAAPSAPVGVIPQALRFATSEVWKPRYERAHDQFFSFLLEPDRARRRTRFEEIMEQDGLLLEVAEIAFHDWYLMDYLDPESPSPPAWQFLESSRARSVGLNGRDWLQACLGQPFGVYEVRSVRPDRGMGLVDLRDDTVLEVAERTASQSLERFDLIGARCVEWQGHRVISGGFFAFERHAREALARLPLEDELRASAAARQEMGPVLAEHWLASALDNQLPILQTPDGEPFVICSQTFSFPCAARASVATALDGALDRDEDSWLWLHEAEGTLGSSVLARVTLGEHSGLVWTTSEKRLDGARDLLNRVLPEGAEWQEVEYEDPGDLLDGRVGENGEPSQLADLGDEELDEINQEFLDRHYQSWMDQPLPALGGGTPRQAAKSPDARPALIELLKDFYNWQVHSGHGYDFFWLWHELGVLEDLCKHIDEQLSQEDDFEDPAYRFELICSVLHTQITRNDPPQTRLTYQDLSARGLSHREAMSRMAGVLATHLGEILADQQGFDNDRYQADLRSLLD